MARANRRRRESAPRDLEQALLGMPRTEEHPDGSWGVRTVSGSADGRRYLCPGCQQMFAGTTPHIVAWPLSALGSMSDRRHWHTACWRARNRRRPGGALY